jgi:hypothetical protein
MQWHCTIGAELGSQARALTTVARAIKIRCHWQAGASGRRHGGGGLGLTPQPARAVGIPARIPCRDIPLVRNVHEHPSQELERVGGIGPRCWPIRLVGAIRHRRRGPVIRQPLQRDGILRAVPGESDRERANVLGHPYRCVYVESGVRPRQHPVGVLMPLDASIIPGGNDTLLLSSVPGGSASGAVAYATMTMVVVVVVAVWIAMPRDAVIHASACNNAPA